MYYVGVRHGKKRKMEKEGEINLSILFYFPTIYLAALKGIQNLKTLALIEAEKSVTEIFIGEEEKWTNNGNDKQEEADSLLHNTTSYTQHICTKFQNPKFSS